MSKFDFKGDAKRNTAAKYNNLFKNTICKEHGTKPVVTITNDLKLNVSWCCEAQKFEVNNMMQKD